MPKRKHRPRPKKVDSHIVTGSPSHIKTNIDLHGLYPDQLPKQLNEFIESAHESGLYTVRIIHGHGLGILKSETIKFLGKNPKVLRWYAAGPAEGGYGATIAELNYGGHKPFNRKHTNSITPRSLTKQHSSDH
tara:strand:+ start:1615 stop:2013 length:399 start_codon:yes stop_codon:yes gene_type:complete